MKKFLEKGSKDPKIQKRKNWRKQGLSFSNEYEIEILKEKPTLNDGGKKI